MANVNNNVTLQSFYSMVSNAERLDGDVRFKGADHDGDLQKVNFGQSSFRRAIRIKALSSRLTETTNSAGVREKLVELLANEGIAGDVMADIKKILGYGEDGQVAQKPLSRRTIRKVFDTLNETKQSGNGGDSVLKGLLDNRVIHGEYKQVAGAKHVGGGRGLTLSSKQFDGIFEQIRDRGYKAWGQHPGDEDFKKVFSNAIDELKRMYAAGQSKGLIEKLFSDGLDIDSIGKKLAELVDTGKAPIPTSVSRKSAQGPAMMDEETTRVIENLRQERELKGDEHLESLISVSLPPTSGKQMSDGEQKARKVLDFASELIFNKDLTEVETVGFSGGERLGRLFLSHVDVFQKLCLDVKNGKDDGSLARNEVLKTLSSIGNGVGFALRDALVELIGRLNVVCFGKNVDIPEDLGKFTSKCFTNAQQIFKTIGTFAVDKPSKKGAGLTMEAFIDKTLLDAKNQFADNICAKLNEERPHGGKSERRTETDILDEATFGNDENKAEKMAIVKDLDPETKTRINRLGGNVYAEAVDKCHKMSKQDSAVENNPKVVHDNSSFNVLEDAEDSKMTLLQLSVQSQIKQLCTGKDKAGQVRDMADLRRMFAAGMRYSDNVEAGETGEYEGVFSESAMLTAMGPYTLKLLQAVSERKDAEMQDALLRIRGNLASMDEEVVRAMALEMIKGSQGLIKKLEITDVLGAASVGVTYRAKITVEGEDAPRNVIIKMLRPDVGMRFEADRLRLQEAIKSQTDNSPQEDKDKWSGIQGVFESEVQSITAELDFTKEQFNTVCSFATYVVGDAKNAQDINVDELLMSMKLVPRNGKTIE